MSVKTFLPTAAGQLLVAQPGVQPVRFVQTSMRRGDIDQAAKYIGAGAATVGVAGSGDEQRFKETSSCKSIAFVKFTRNAKSKRCYAVAISMFVFAYQ